MRLEVGGGRSGFKTAVVTCIALSNSAYSSAEGVYRIEKRDEWRHRGVSPPRHNYEQHRSYSSSVLDESITL